MHWVHLVLGQQKDLNEVPAFSFFSFLLTFYTTQEPNSLNIRKRHDHQATGKSKICFLKNLSVSKWKNSFSKSDYTRQRQQIASDTDEERKED